MARYAFSVAQVVNLTTSEIAAYAWDGSIIRLLPSRCTIDCHSNVVYLIKYSQWGEMRSAGIPNDRLVIACHKGTGRGGVKVHELRTLGYPERRVMPYRGA